MSKKISNTDQLMSFAKSIGWFEIEPSEYSGKGNVKTRKAPSSSAKSHKIGTIRKGMDGNKWKVIKTKKGYKTWVKN